MKRRVSKENCNDNSNAYWHSLFQNWSDFVFLARLFIQFTAHSFEHSEWIKNHSYRATEVEIEVFLLSSLKEIFSRKRSTHLKSFNVCGHFAEICEAMGGCFPMYFNFYPCSCSFNRHPTNYPNNLVNAHWNSKKNEISLERNCDDIRFSYKCGHTHSNRPLTGLADDLGQIKYHLNIPQAFFETKISLWYHNFCQSRYI